jgi:alcohol dehydrogenase class IV
MKALRDQNHFICAPFKVRARYLGTGRNAMTLPSTNWNYPTAIRFGNGRSAELPKFCAELGLKRPLLVTDAGLRHHAMVQEAITRNRDAGLPTDVFADVKPNPNAANVEAGVAAYRAGDHDGVIALGGGSGLDAAKAIAFMAGQNRPIWDFEDIGDWWTRADAKRIAPIIAVPTTAGTGSEVGRAAVILDEASHTKKVIFHPKMMPSIVISDPSLTAGLPAHLTAATGMDALAHCLEAYCAPGFHPMAEGIAVEGMRLVKEFLPRAVANGTDLDARGAMLAAASMGATAFQKGLGGIHALSHPVGALYDTHHGLTNGVFMPYVLQLNRSAIDEKMTRLAAWLNLPNPSFSAFLNWILDLRHQFNVPHSLADLLSKHRIDDAAAAKIAAMAEADPTAGGNPIPFDRVAARTVLDTALTGRMI